jgi:hypothetical protein
MQIYIEECKQLSLTAREAISLLVIERFCFENKIENILIDDFLDYMWEWPLIDGPEQFEPWEAAKPDLVNYGLGDSAPKLLVKLLEKNDICGNKFRSLIEGAVEILWSSFWGAAQNERSYESLHDVIVKSGVEKLPVLTPFRFSLFHQGNGWGNKLNRADRDFWRNYYKMV